MGTTLKFVVVFVLAAAAVLFFVMKFTWWGVGLAALTVMGLVATAATVQRAVLKVKKTVVTLKIVDATGSLAHYEKVQELIPLRRPLVDIRDRNLFTRGRLDELEVSPGEVAERMSLGKYYIAKVVFKPPLAPGVTVNRRVAYNIYDGFIDDDVAFMFVGDYATDDFTLRVEFPADRLPRRARAYVKVEGRPAKEATLERSPDGGVLSWRVAGLKPGVHYHVEWNW